MAATDTSVPKLYRHNALQRVRDADLEEISSLSEELLMESMFGLICNENVLIHGFDIAHSADRDFSVAAGAMIHSGQLLKDGSGSTITLDEEVAGNPRIDIVYVNGPSLSFTDSATRVSMTGITRTALGGAASIGTGDGSTTAFDLGHSGVDPHTLQVFVDAVQVGGWSFSQGTGASSKDQVIFGTAPAGSAAITADYTHQSGGVEGSGSLNTRISLSPNYEIEKGTPASSPVAPTGALPSGAIQLAHIQVPASWSGGASGVVVSQETDASGDDIREYMVFKHRTADPTDHTPNESPSGGRIYGALRGITQVMHGCRVQYVSADTIQVTPGWGVMNGVSFRLASSKSLQLQNSSGGAPGYVNSTGWWYLYGVVEITSSYKPGSALELDVSTDPPDFLRRDSSTTVGYVYLGALYVDHTGVTIRPFYTHGDWTYWQAPSSIALSSGTNPVPVTDWCPSTGQILLARVALSYTPNAVGDTFTLSVQSHKDTTALPYPMFQAACAPPTNSNAELSYATGIVKAEETASVRNIHTVYTVGASGTDSANLFVMGYRDDYRTMNGAGAPTFY